MPSSVVFAALVLAWLVVLVPVVARRRQMVPRPAEADLSAKVLPRGGAGVSGVGAATGAANGPMEEVPVASAHVGRGGGAMLADAVTIETTRGSTVLAERDLDQELDRELELDAHEGAEAADTAGPSGAPAPRGSRERLLDRRDVAPDHRDDVDDVSDVGDSDVEDSDDFDALDDYDDEAEDSDGRPRTYRPGRGGFDPEAAEVAAHVRYAFRQRVALGLIAVAVLSALAALIVTPALWWLHVVTDVVLVGYLVYLRRQTRIEEEVRARRAARLSGERRALAARRERQAEHEHRMATHRQYADEWGGWSDTGDHPVVADAMDDGFVEDAEIVDDPEPAPRWAAPRTPAPPVPDGMELVDDSDDDPAFHTLDAHHRGTAYRRAAAGA